MKRGSALTLAVFVTFANDFALAQQVDPGPFFGISTSTDPSRQVTVQANDRSITERVLWQDLFDVVSPADASLVLDSSTLGARQVATVKQTFSSTSSVPLTIQLLTEKTTPTLSNEYDPLVLLPASQSASSAISNVRVVPNSTTTQFQAVRGGPVRIVESNGLSYDAMQVSVSRDGVPWRSWYFALNLGLVRISSEGSDAPFGFRPVAFPSPITGGTVVEYVDTEDFPTAPGGHYFYSVDPAEQAAVDAGAAGKFRRTGSTFNAGGYVQLCRFFGSIQPGPNSHFFTANRTECDQLRQMQVVPTPTTVQQWNHEGAGFAVSLPVNNAGGGMSCPSGLRSIHRLYNNAYTVKGKNPWDSNHRFTANALGEVPAMVALGWVDEGIAFCAPE